MSPQTLVSCHCNAHSAKNSTHCRDEEPPSALQTSWHRPTVEMPHQTPNLPSTSYCTPFSNHRLHTSTRLELTPTNAHLC